MRIARRSLLGGVAGIAALAAAGCGEAAGSAPPAAAGRGTAWTDLPAGPVPPADALGRWFIQTRIPATVGAATVGGPAGPGLHGNLPDAQSASYVLQDLGAEVTEIGATFAFGPGAETGSLCLARFDRWPGNAEPAVLPRSTCHLALTPRRWNYGVLLGPVLQTVASGPLARPVPQDGTPATLRIVLTGSTAVLDTPDGTRHRIDDPRIGAPSTDAVACWEFYKLAPGAADVTFLRTWASA